MTSFLNTLAISVLDTICAQSAAKAARVETLANGFPWDGTKAAQKKERDEVRKAYVIGKRMEWAKASRADAVTFVEANYKGISTDGHVLRKAFDAAKSQLNRDLKEAADIVNARRKAAATADKAAVLIDVKKVTDGAAQVRAPRPSKNTADKAADKAADAPTQEPTKIAPPVLIPAEALPEAMRAHQAEAIKAAKAFKAANAALFKSKPALGEAWAELIAAQEKAAVILARALQA